MVVAEGFGSRLLSGRISAPRCPAPPWPLPDAAAPSQALLRPSSRPSPGREPPTRPRDRTCLQPSLGLVPKTRQAGSARGRRHDEPSPPPARRWALGRCSFLPSCPATPSLPRGALGWLSGEPDGAPDGGLRRAGLWPSHSLAPSTGSRRRRRAGANWTEASVQAAHWRPQPCRGGQPVVHSLSSLREPASCHCRDTSFLSPAGQGRGPLSALGGRWPPCGL